MTVKNVPSELAALDQWVIWRLVKRKGKTTKVPHRASDGRQASTTTTADWCSLEEALEAKDRFHADGIGFVFSVDDPYCGIDLDKCVDEEGDIHPDAYVLIQKIDSYAEISPSGTGVHIIVRGELGAGTRTADTPWGGNLEAYDHGRYFTFTGKSLNGDKVTERNVKLDLSGSEDYKLIERCRKNSSGFAALFDEGDASEYGNNHSAADIALANMIAARSDDPAQIERIMRQSAMVRQKWDTPDTGSIWLYRRAIEPALESKKKRPDGGGQWTWDEGEDVKRQLYMLRIREEARTQFRVEKAASYQLPYPTKEWSLADELALPPRDYDWRVQDLQMVGSNVVLIAGYKLGKTTLVMNLIRSLADGAPFLGIYDTRPVEGNIAVFNYELDPVQWVDWARDMRIQNPQMIKPFHLRGLGALQFWLPEVQDRLVAWMVENEIKYWVLDPTAQAWANLLESEGDNLRAQTFTSAIDVIKARANINEANLTHHTSRDPTAQDKGRGPSALEGWYDAGWFLTGKRDNLKFHAIGRDVDISQTDIAYHEDKKRSFLVDDRSHREDVMERKETKSVTIEILHELGPLSQSALGKELRLRGCGVSQNKLKTLLAGWAKAIDNHIAFKEEKVDGRRQRTFFLDLPGEAPVSVP